MTLGDSLAVRRASSLGGRPTGGTEQRGGLCRALEDRDKAAAYGVRVVVRSRFVADEIAGAKDCAVAVY